MDDFDAIRLIALREVINSRRRKPKEGDSEYPLRQIFRWYSKQFHTPLHTVSTLPLRDILQAYWEVHYEDMDAEALEGVRLQEIETPEELSTRQRQEDAEDADSLNLAKEILAEELAAAAVEAKDLEKAPMQTRDSVISNRLRNLSKEVELITDTLKELPPGITMTFVDDFDEDVDSFGLLDDPKKK